MKLAFLVVFAVTIIAAMIAAFAYVYGQWSFRNHLRIARENLIREPESRLQPRPILESVLNL